MPRSCGIDIAAAEADESLFEAPDDLVCPITHGIFSSPVITTVGTVYEEAAIREHMQRSRCDPLTGQRMGDQLTPIIYLRAKAREHARATAVRCVERASSPDCDEPERFLRRAYDVVEEAGIDPVKRLPAREVVQTPAALLAAWNAVHVHPSSLPARSSAADLRLLFCYARTLAATASTNDAAALATYFLRRSTANRRAAGEILRDCVENGWPEPPPKPLCPSDSASQNGLQQRSGCAGAVIASEERDACSGEEASQILLEGATTSQSREYATSMHAPAMSASTSAVVREIASTCVDALTWPEVEPPLRRRPRRPRPQDGAFADDAVNFMLSQPRLRACTGTFLTILMDDAGVSASAITVICEGLIRAAAHSAAAQRAPLVHASAQESLVVALETEDLVGLLEQSVYQSAGTRSGCEAAVHSARDGGPCMAVHVGSCSRRGGCASASAAAKELQRRLEESQMALQAVPALLAARDRAREMAAEHGPGPGCTSVEPRAHADRGAGGMPRGDVEPDRHAAARALTPHQAVSVVFIAFVMFLLIYGAHICVTIWQHLAGGCRALWDLVEDGVFDLIPSPHAWQSRDEL